VRSLAPLLAAILSTAPLTIAQGDGGAVPDRVNAFCPVIPDEPVDPSVTAEWNGRTVAFCCKMCRKDFLANPEAFAAELSAPPVAEAVGSPPRTQQTPPPEGSPAKAHGEGHGPQESGAGPRPSSWKAFLGRLHPLFVHFPIALLILAGLAELLARPQSPRWRARARFALALGAPTAVLAAWLGWIAAQESSYPTLQNVLFRHRWLGIATACFACLSLVAAPRERARGGRRERLYRWLVVATMILVILTGHHGGTLVFGPDHLRLPG